MMAHPSTAPAGFLNTVADLPMEWLGRLHHDDTRRSR